MPVVHPSSYHSPLFLRNGHLQTIYSNMCRRVKNVEYQRVRIETPDGDFLDLDSSSAGSDRIVIIAHGLEGSSQRPYVLGMVRALNQSGRDALAWNFRGCSGEANRRLRSYHSGDTEDLNTVLNHVCTNNRYRRIDLVGFSLGGNIILKYLGERARSIVSTVGAAVVFSVPCDLRSGALRMGRPSNWIYMRRFLRMLHEKIRAKKELFPGQIDDRGYHEMSTFEDFDNRYTAPLHGFKSAEDYWSKASSKPLLHAVSIPTLLVNALDDPFLPAPCYPYAEAEANPCLFLETPRNGGHVGFVAYDGGGRYWSEARAVRFLEAFDP